MLLHTLSHSCTATNVLPSPHTTMQTLTHPFRPYHTLAHAYTFLHILACNRTISNDLTCPCKLPHTLAHPRPPNRRTQQGSLWHRLGPVVLMFFLDQPAVCLFFLPVLHFPQMAKASSTPPPPRPSPFPKGSIFPLGKDLTRKNERLGIVWWGRLLSEGLHS